ncbi:uncharacterized protein LOC129952662 isoform X1 [Eupeodes corollae]|uniref:uncharacterized protein LOC129952662 isoform X1 n=2 Tax=Eupeodes corollae TaxID=290404 RepID=UPI00248FA37B|nr:uncharacterized protein LOC129952662 isoform X1 [Eupeodes corollae]
MMNNKPKGKQLQQQPQQETQSKPQTKKASKTQRTQPPAQPSASDSPDIKKSTSSIPYNNNNKPKNTVTVPEANRNTSGQKNDNSVSNLSASLKRLNYNNKKASKASGSHQNSSNKRNHHPSSGTSRMKSRDEDHKNDPMGHKKNQFGKMRLTEFLNIDQGNTTKSGTSKKTSTTTSSSSSPSSSSASSSSSSLCAKCSTPAGYTNYSLIDPMIFTGKQFQKKNSRYGKGSSSNNNNNNQRNEPRNVMMNSTFVPIAQPKVPILSSSNIAAVIADTDRFTIFEKTGKLRTSYPIMQCGTLGAPDSYHHQRSTRMDAFQIDDGFHSDGGTETPPPSPSSGSSIASTSDHGSLESVDTGGAQRLAVLSFEQVRKLHDVMDETVAIHGRGNFPTLEVKLKDLVNSVRRKLETDVAAGGAGVIVKDIRLNGGAASHVLASEDQPYNDLDLIYAIEFSSNRHFDRVKTAVLNTLLDLLPEGVSKRRIMPCALKEAYVGKMVKVNNNNDGDRWSLISLGNSPGHKNVELKFVDTMRRQFEFSVDSFQIVLDSLLLFYDCAALPISENFYPTVVGESVYGDFQEALYHLQKKLISTRQPEEIRGGGLLKYCNLLVRNYKPVDAQRIKTLERYMCSRFFIDFPDIGTQTVKLEAYLRNHFWGIVEEPLQYQYLMHLREVVETSTVCLMGHERRQTLLLIQSLAMQVLCRESQKHHNAQVYEQYQQHHHQQQQAQHQQHQQQQQLTQAIVVDLQAQQNASTSQHVLVQQSPQSNQASTSCCISQTQDGQQQQVLTVTQQQTSATIPQTIQIQAGPPGLIYANGVYYAPVIPATICTCNSTWLST